MDEDQIIAEGKALAAALAVVEEQKDRRVALEAVQQYRTTYAQPNNVEGVVIDTALRVICGEPVEGLDFKWDAAENTVDWVAKAWVAWAQGKVDEKIRNNVDILIAAQPNFRGGYLHGMALHQCLLALKALFENDRTEAQRRFHRAIKLGTEYGTPSNPIVQWTYAASFFNHEE